MKARKNSEPTVFEHYSIPLHVTIRVCTKRDVPQLEWAGIYTAHRQFIRNTYKAQERGDVLMLVAETNCFPAGQIWIDLAKKREEGVGFLWAMRVVPWLQRMGIGTSLMNAAEEVLRSRGFAWAELGVEKENTDAQRFYERRGYFMVSSNLEVHKYRTPWGTNKRMTIDEWILRKDLAEPQPAVASAPVLLPVEAENVSNVSKEEKTR